MPPIAEWTKVCERIGAADAQTTEAVAARRDALRVMLKEERFLELQKQVPAENIVPTLRRRIAHRAGWAAAAGRERWRTADENAPHSADASETLLQRSGRTIPKSLRQELGKRPENCGACDIARRVSPFSLPADGGDTAHGAGRRELASPV